MKPARVLIFGDSIAEGYWDSQGGWADRLKRDSFQNDLANNNIGYGISIINLGISADGSTQVLKRLEQESLVRKVDRGDAIFILAIGVNDSNSVGEQSEYYIEPEGYRSNMQKLMGVMKKYTNRIIIVGLTPVDESLTLPIYENIWYSNDRIAEFDAIAKQIADQNEAEFVDVFNAWKKIDYKSLLIDGLHPNDAGHDWIAEQVKPVLQKLLAV